MIAGARNLITDVAGLTVGNAEDMRLRSGSTVLVGQQPFTAGVHVMGGAPGTRETDLLAPDKMVEQVDALVLSGGSAFGLDACSGVADGLRAAGRGFDVAGQKVPIVPGAILFDLSNGGDKSWGRNPYYALGAAAVRSAHEMFGLGSVGAGSGATTIAIVATDAALTQAQCTRMAVAAHDGMARAIVPSHTPMDGDLVFGVSTGNGANSPETETVLQIGHAAATCLARAIARGVFAATGWDAAPLPAWKDLHG
ncbi:MAG: P1 family peptidase [Paracoccaceae bacterium]|jgi:L-aminopeptidase/D-esterase-like protein|nr:P1 family peptidase [Paracoccaceae bacterium]MDP7186055.1 P1 family peptidase [Paracoccaceae bacterium]